KSMHQIAFVDSEYIIPAAIYIGGKLRHPFRIYADDKKALCVIVCEAPLRPEGIHSIMELVVTWASRNRVREVLVLDGVPVRRGGLPNKHRKPMILSSSTSPSSSTDVSKYDDSVKSAMMMGVSGGLISACLSDEMFCTCVLIPSTSGIPDPEGAAMLLEAISQIPNVSLEIDVEPLRREGQAIKRQLKGFMDSVSKEQEEEGKGRYLRSSRIYG
ncbi:MAG: PAC2 family protein, partial [Thermoproteota archaeon]|nr:PAC2 family protein [Thermoproteota archaeon]